MHPCLEQAARFDSLQEFYDQNPARRHSEEVDYGCHWTLIDCPPHFGLAPRWRVSYVRNTGEVYAVRLSRQDEPLYVLAIVPPDEVDDREFRELYYATLEGILDGWAERCAKPNSLPWAVITLREWAQRQAIPTEQRS